MLQNNIYNFLHYCKNSSFSERSIESLTFRLKEFNQFLNTIPVCSVADINFQLLAQFITDFKNPSVHVKKARIRSLRQFFHYRKLKQLIPDNIALNLPYPKIEKKIPQFLTNNEFKLILKHFVQHATTPIGLRNLVIISLLGFLGLRTAATIKICRPIQFTL